MFVIRLGTGGAATGVGVGDSVGVFRIRLDMQTGRRVLDDEQSAGCDAGIREADTSFPFRPVNGAYISNLHQPRQDFISIHQYPSKTRRNVICVS